MSASGPFRSSWPRISSNATSSSCRSRLRDLGAAGGVRVQPILDLGRDPVEALDEQDVGQVGRRDRVIALPEPRRRDRQRQLLHAVADLRLLGRGEVAPPVAERRLLELGEPGPPAVGADQLDDDRGEQVDQVVDDQVAKRLEQERTAELVPHRDREQSSPPLAGGTGRIDRDRQPEQVQAVARRVGRIVAQVDPEQLVVVVEEPLPLIQGNRGLEVQRSTSLERSRAATAAIGGQPGDDAGGNRLAGCRGHPDRTAGHSLAHDRQRIAPRDLAGEHRLKPVELPPHPEIEVAAERRHPVLAPDVGLLDDDRPRCADLPVGGVDRRAQVRQRARGPLIAMVQPRPRTRRSRRGRHRQDQREGQAEKTRPRPALPQHGPHPLSRPGRFDGTRCPSPEAARRGDPSPAGTCGQGESAARPLGPGGPELPPGVNKPVAIARADCYFRS